MKTILAIFVGSFLMSLSAFVMYYIGLDDHTVTDLLWGALASAILMAVLYLSARIGIERFSVAWAIGIITGIGLVAVGLSMSLSDVRSDMYMAWGDFMWFSGLWIMLGFIGLPKEHRYYEWSFFKRPRPIDKATE